jgi:hypothetical protein
MYISTPNYSFIIINCCIFTQCKAWYGGALYLESNTPHIYSTRTRFENNSATFDGDDIYVSTSTCFNLAQSGSLDSSVCSTTSLGNRVYCSGDVSQLQNNCSEIVWKYFFLLFLDFIFLFAIFVHFFIKSSVHQESSRIIIRMVVSRV